jgi:hypothetical protein
MVRVVAVLTRYLRFAVPVDLLTTAWKVAFNRRREAVVDLQSILVRRCAMPNETEMPQTAG